MLCKTIHRAPGPGGVTQQDKETILTHQGRKLLLPHGHVQSQPQGAARKGSELALGNRVDARRFLSEKDLLMSEHCSGLHPKPKALRIPQHTRSCTPNWKAKGCGLTNSRDHSRNIPSTDNGRKLHSSPDCASSETSPRASQPATQLVSGTLTEAS